MTATTSSPTNSPTTFYLLAVGCNLPPTTSTPPFTRFLAGYRCGVEEEGGYERKRREAPNSSLHSTSFLLTSSLCRPSSILNQ